MSQLISDVNAGRISADVACAACQCAAACRVRSMSRAQHLYLWGHTNGGQSRVSRSSSSTSLHSPSQSSTFRAAAMAAGSSWASRCAAAIDWPHVVACIITSQASVRSICCTLQACVGGLHVAIIITCDSIRAWMCYSKQLKCFQLVW
jgi:hypothetical protein